MSALVVKIESSHCMANWVINTMQIRVILNHNVYVALILILNGYACTVQRFVRYAAKYDFYSEGSPDNRNHHVVDSACSMNDAE